MSKANLSPPVGPNWKQITLLVVGIFMLLQFEAITRMSYDCEQSDPKMDRPLLEVIGMFTSAGIGWLVACWCVVWRGGWAKMRSVRTWGTNSTSLWMVVGLGIAFRLVLLVSVPIQEVDLFRYIWDGTVVTEGISPYEYSPQEIEFYPTRGVPSYRTMEERKDIEMLSKIATSPGMKRGFGLVHFEAYTTPYPLVNQPAFALAAAIGRTTNSFWGLLFAMKGVLTLFDIATAFLLIGLLKRLSLPAEWIVVYFWCPLLLKEIANSGHLDSIAVFFSVAAVYLMVRTYWTAATDENQPVDSLVDRPVDQEVGGSNMPSDFDPAVSLSATTDSTAKTFLFSNLIAIVLAAAVAAKLFPAVLGPIWAVVMLKRIRFAAFLPLVIFAVTTVLLLWPMVGKTDLVKRQLNDETYRPFLVAGVKVLEPAHPVSVQTAPPAGIEAFAKYWEMNDCIFMVAIENLKPYGKSAQEYVNKDGTKGSKIWFVKTSNQFRHSISQWYADLAGVTKKEAPFSMTRRATLLIFCFVVLWGCYRVWRYDDPLTFLEMTFLMVAWFWFLAPTQNPWYWTWALPWLVFCRNRVWFFVAVAAMAYYLRFYFEYHGAPEPGTEGLFGTPYASTAFFDFVVPVIEFAPILFLLLVTWIVRSISSFRSDDASLTQAQ